VEQRSFNGTSMLILIVAYGLTGREMIEFAQQNDEIAHQIAER